MEVWGRLEGWRLAFVSIYMLQGDGSKCDEDVAKRRFTGRFLGSIARKDEAALK